MGVVLLLTIIFGTVCPLSLLGFCENMWMMGDLSYSYILSLIYWGFGIHNN
jgi:hypothetical protein